MPSVKVGDLTMHYEVHGDGIPLLVIWGIGGEIPSLISELAERTSGNYQVIHFDNRGSGRTEKPDIPYSIEMMADDTAGLMDAIGIRRAHILGISTGSRIALAVAARHPDKVRSLVLHVAAARSPDREDPEAAAAFERLRVAMTQPGFAETVLAHPPTVASFERQYEALRLFDGRSLLGQIGVPVLIVNGTRDRSTPVGYVEELRAGIPGARLVLVDSHHMFARITPDLLIRPALAFLTEVDAKPVPCIGGDSE
ncbi:MAG: alpha/beta hydrolase [Massilibacteroides sp.]|nr:alpha/beta hydrolase [Massilibacteroides sp.]